MTINLGNIISVNGRSVGSGIASNLDSGAIIEELATVKRLPAVDLENTLDLNASKVDAFAQLSTILENFKTSVDFLRNPAGFNSTQNNLFEFRTSSLLSNTSNAASNFLSIVASPGAQLGDFTIAIDNLAEAKSIRTNGFTSQTASVTEAASGSTAELFSAGNFQTLINGDVTTSATGIAYATSGSGDGVAVDAATPLDNISGATDAGLIGGIQTVAATIDGSNVDITITLDNGRQYVAEDVPANQGAGSDSVLQGAITFTNATTGGSFDVNIIKDFVIGGIQANADTMASEIQTGLAGVDIFQSRSLDNFKGIGNLGSDDVKLVSDGFDITTGDHGQIENFVFTAVSTSGANDGTISVVIDGETYQATGLGDDGSDTETGNLVLNSTTTDKQLQINIADAGLTLDFSSDAAATANEATFNAAFGARVGDFTIDEGDSLVDIAAAINAQTATSGVSASILQVSETDFRLTIKSEDEGVANAFTFVDPDDVVGDVTFNTVQAAEDASFSIDGISLTRSGNIIDDAISGVTLNLLGETSDFGGPSEENVTVSILRDTDTVEAGIVNFINAYNDFRVFVAEQSQRTDDDSELEDGAVLGRDTTLQNIINQVSTEINRVVDGVTDGDFASLGSIGIGLTDFEGDSETIPTTNILTYDPVELQNFLSSNFDKIREIFEFRLDSSSSDFTTFKTSNSLTLTDFKVDIDTGRATGDQIRILDTNNNLLFNADFDGTKITGQSGTALEGMEFIYTGDGTDIITVGASQGIADRLYNFLEGNVEDGGAIDNAVDFITEQDSRIEDEIARIDDQVERFRETLLAQYTALEAAISQVNTLLDFLDAQSQAFFGND